MRAAACCVCYTRRGAAAAPWPRLEGGSPALTPARTGGHQDKTAAGDPRRLEPARPQCTPKRACGHRSTHACAPVLAASGLSLAAAGPCCVGALYPAHPSQRPATPPFCVPFMCAGTAAAARARAATTPPVRGAQAGAARAPPHEAWLPARPGAATTQTRDQTRLTGRGRGRGRGTTCGGGSTAMGKRLLLRDTGTEPDTRRGGRPMVARYVW